MHVCVCEREGLREEGNNFKIRTIQCLISPAQYPPNWCRSDILHHSFLGLFYSLSFILKTGCTDPGIIPRARPDEIDYMISLGDVGEPLYSKSVVQLMHAPL